MIDSLLIANRSEIASRIIRTCQQLGIRSIAVFSEADAGLPFVQQADTAIALPGVQASTTYLNQQAILDAARTAGATAIHPGYGFLSESAEFARAVQAAGLIWVGPKPDAIEQMGLKAQAKAIAIEQQVPVIPGYNGEAQDEATLKAAALKIGFPVLLKASAGGGGKGMRIVHESTELSAAIQSAKNEAQQSFGNDRLLIERYFPSARHIEIQVIADQQGHVLHLLERECSIQRRYQKIIEESPSPVLTAEDRQAMGQAAVRLCQAIGYDSLGTVEFIYTPEKEFYFLEVNTRLQVEHPVTEMITGLDLVAWQIRIAEGEVLDLQQEEIKANGYAIECRLYAENPAQNFMPDTGKVVDWYCPPMEGLRYEAGLASGSEVSVYYDPMLAKVIAHGRDRKTALRRMRRALNQLRCQGLVTNQRFLIDLLDDKAFQAGQYDTHFLQTHFLPNWNSEIDILAKQQAAIALCFSRWQQRKAQQPILPNVPSGFRNNFYQHQQEKYKAGQTEITVAYRLAEDHFEVLIDEASFTVSIIRQQGNTIRLEVNNLQADYFVATANAKAYFVQSLQAGTVAIELVDRFPDVGKAVAAGGYQSPVPGEVLKVLVKEGERVEEGQALVVLMSMKMENTIQALEAGIVKSLFVEEGETVEAGKLLVDLRTDKGEEAS